MYEYATYARQSKAGDWYVGSLSAIERTLQVPLDFLDEGVTYVADIYADGADADAYAGWNSAAKSAQTLENEQYLVTSETTLERDLKYGFGYAVKLTKATQEELETLPVYDVNRERVQSLLRQAEILDESSYTAETWAALQEAVEAANALLADDASTPEQLVAAAEALQQAIDGLRSKKALTEAIQKASVLTEGYYTPSTWSILEAALNEAERLLDAQQVSQAEIDEAAAELETAIEGLVLLSGLEVIDSTYLDTLDWESIPMPMQTLFLKTSPMETCQWSSGSMERIQRLNTAWEPMRSPGFITISLEWALRSLRRRSASARPSSTKRWAM